jgi:hypothetical protein
MGGRQSVVDEELGEHLPAVQNTEELGVATNSS